MEIECEIDSAKQFEGLENVLETAVNLNDAEGLVVEENKNR